MYRKPWSASLRQQLTAWLTLVLVPGYTAAAPDVLTARLAELRAVHNIPVLAVSLIKDQPAPETIVLGATEATPLRWGSISKTFTALTVLTLAEDKLVDLNAPLSQYVSARTWQNPWRDTHPVRLIHLLELRAGFTDLSGMEFDYNQPLSLSDALALNPAHRTTRWPPGLQHGYSNLSPGLTQALIEQVTKQTYATAVAERVFKALQMPNAGFAPDPNLPGGFKADGKTPIPYWHMTFPAYGALNAPLADLQQLLIALLPNNKALNKTIRESLFTPQGRELAPHFTFDYAAGLYPRVRQGRIWHTHGGDADGYRSRLAVLAGQRRGYIANINTDNPMALRQIEQVLERYLSEDLPAPAKPGVAQLKPAVLQALSGDYYPSSVRFGVARWRAGEQSSARVTAEDGALIFSRSGRTTRLLPVTEDLFRRRADPTATAVFFYSGEQLYLQGELGNFVRTDACPQFLSSLPQCKRR